MLRILCMLQWYNRYSETVTYSNDAAERIANSVAAMAMLFDAYASTWHTHTRIMQAVAPFLKAQLAEKFPHGIHRALLQYSTPPTLGLKQATLAARPDELSGYRHKQQQQPSSGTPLHNTARLTVNTHHRVS